MGQGTVAVAAGEVLVTDAVAAAAGLTAQPELTWVVLTEKVDSRCHDVVKVRRLGGPLKNQQRRPG